jgi:hypothetical protein
MNVEQCHRLLVEAQLQPGDHLQHLLYLTRAPNCACALSIAGRWFGLVLFARSDSQHPDNAHLQCSVPAREADECICFNSHLCLQENCSAISHQCPSTDAHQPGYRPTTAQPTLRVCMSATMRTSPTAAPDTSRGSRAAGMTPITDPSPNSACTWHTEGAVRARCTATAADSALYICAAPQTRGHHVISAKERHRGRKPAHEADRTTAIYQSQASAGQLLPQRL